MDLSQYVETLRRELGTLTQFAADDVTRAASLLAGALDSPVRLTLLEALSAATAEITARLDDTVVDLRLIGGEPDFVITTVPLEEPIHTAGTAAGGGDGADDAGTARITLRLPESLKIRIEAEAAAAGLSVNAWLVRAAARAAEGTGVHSGKTYRSVGQRITGYAHS
jgi:hypothetical protein